MTEWHEIELGDAMTVHHGFAFQGEHFSDEGSLVVLTPGNFFDSGGFKPKSGKEKFYKGPLPDGYLLSRGDVVIAMTEQAQGLLGSSATIPCDGVYLHNQRIGLVEVLDCEVLNQRFVYHLMNTPLVRNQLQASATGTKVRHTAPARIKAVRVNAPCVTVQMVIAEILDAVDDLIENNRRRIELLEQMAQAIYREWFVHFRYPGHEDASLVDSPLGPIPQGWNVRRLGELAGINVSSRKPRDDETVRYLDISCLGDRSLIPPRSVEGSQAPGRARRVVRAGDVVWSLVRPNRRAHALLVEPGPDWIASTGLAVLTAMHVSSAYLFEAVSELRFSDHLTSQEGGSAYPAVKPKDFEAAVVLVPSPAVDHQFAELVGAQHRLVWTLRAHSEKLASLRDLLLPGLVTGRIDVSELNLDAVAESVA